MRIDGGEHPSNVRFLDVLLVSRYKCAGSFSLTVSKQGIEEQRNGGRYRQQLVEPFDTLLQIRREVSRGQRFFSQKALCHKLLVVKSAKPFSFLKMLVKGTLIELDVECPYKLHQIDSRRGRAACSGQSLGEPRARSQSPGPLDESRLASQK